MTPLFASVLRLPGNAALERIAGGSAAADDQWSTVGKPLKSAALGIPYLIVARSQTPWSLLRKCVRPTDFSLSGRLAWLSKGWTARLGGWRERPSYFWRQAVRPSVDGAADAPTQAELVDP
jgi:hypothetical protein